MYKAIFLGIATYASSVWVHRCDFQFVRKAALQGQRSALLSITKAYQTTSTDALPVIAGVFPLDLEVQLSAAVHHNKHGSDATI